MVGLTRSSGRMAVLIRAGRAPVLILATIGVNPALIGIILGIDRILDMCRTTLNVTGDITAAVYVAKSEGFPLLDGEAGGPVG